MSKPTSGICVDASCLGNPGPMQYRIVRLEGDNSMRTVSMKMIFESSQSPGTNNIGEFLAVVHALAMCKKNDWPDKVYTDSVTAMAWVRKCKCKTTLEAISPELSDVIVKSENWLKENTEFTADRILKWDTKLWGEIPADFGRK